jgi:hypothetical protein
VQRLDKRPTHKAVSVGAGGLQSLEEPEMRSKAPSYLRGSDGGISPWSGEIGLAIRTAGVDLPAAGRADPRVIAGIEDAAIICRCWLGINGRSPYLSATPGGVADMAQPPDPRAGGYPQGPAPGYNRAHRVSRAIRRQRDFRLKRMVSRVRHERSGVYSCGSFWLCRRSS